MGTFLSELKRRKVLRVAAGYVVASWVLLQVADLLTDILELPASTPKVTLLVVLVGFIPALILSWAYDLMPDRSSESGTRSTSGAAPAILSIALLVAGLGVASWWYSGKDMRWAREEGIRQIEQLLEEGKSESAYAVALRVDSLLPGDAEMQGIWASFAWLTSIPSEPAGATVYRRAYGDADAKWLELGQTPLENIHVPFGPSVLRFEAPGYLPLQRVIGGGVTSVTDLLVEAVPAADFISVNPEVFRLETDESLPDGMVRVPQGSAMMGGQEVAFDSFLPGRTEVSNEEFQVFVDAGGYARPEYWQHDFVDEGVTLPFADASARLVDSTGRPGPSTWLAGAYPEGKGSFPVSGISWYEAAAYAAFVGKELPTVHHWRRAFADALIGYQLQASNVDTKDVAAVGTSEGIGWTGTYDMLGNVREWCVNATANGDKVIVGGAAEDAHYLVEESVWTPFRVPAFDRSAANGMRLASSNDEAGVAAELRAAILDLEPTPFLEVASDEVFAAMLSDFDYDRSALRPEIEETIESRHWTRQRVSIVTSDGESRIPILVYLPKRGTPPYQTVMYWPGASTQFFDSIDATTNQMDFVLRNGRAVVLPIMEGMLNRRWTSRPGWDTHSGRDLAITQIREFRRAIDYVETRDDLASDSLAYAGFSWGGRVGAMVLAIESRFKTGVLNQAGINAGDHSDINVVHFLPRVTIPVLQFSGRYDTDFRFDTSSKPFFERLGTDPQHKKHVVEPTGHYVAKPVVSGETLNWLDKYLGPVD